MSAEKKGEGKGEKTYHLLERDVHRLGQEEDEERDGEEGEGLRVTRRVSRDEWEEERDETNGEENVDSEASASHLEEHGRGSAGNDEVPCGGRG